MLDFQKYKEQQLEDPEFRKEYEVLEGEMNAIRAQFRAQIDIEKRIQKTMLKGEEDNG